MRKFSYLFLLVLVACQSNDNTEEITITDENHPKEAVAELLDQPSENYIDTLKYLKIIQELEGIEKFYVNNDLLRLHSLLKYKNDELHITLESDLKGNKDYLDYFIILERDVVNGYIKFQKANTESMDYMTYWNQKNGDKLIAHVSEEQTMFISSSISFKVYNSTEDTYSMIENEKIIPEINELYSLKPKNHIDGDGYDLSIVLPKKGKNINYCVTEECIELLWNDGTFLIKK